MIPEGGGAANGDSQRAVVHGMTSAGADSRPNRSLPTTIQP
jgi:hypothetical protein